MYHGLLLHHETLQSLQSLQKRDRLSLSQRLAIHCRLEHSIVKGRIILLLQNSQVAQNAADNVQIERHSVALDGADSHQVEHSFRIEIRLINSELFDGNIGKAMIDSLGESVNPMIGR